MGCGILICDAIRFQMMKISYLANPCILCAGYYYSMVFQGVFIGRRPPRRLNEETVRKAVLAALLFVGPKLSD
ncbi:MAG: hypothetical protein C4B58_13805 [Deltaproteobacteria bacterium]|nr:MAG: hypothetical protein C4B58_13805 [Deltaproteobacteria bacterium]